MYRASSEGISVAKPYGDSHPYDFLVQHGRRLLRVQVKSTFRSRDSDSESQPQPKPKRRFGYQVIVARIGNGKKGSLYYSREEIDFVVCFIEPADLWYIIPVEKLGRRHAIRLFPHGKGQPFGGLYEDYREAWDLLKEENSSTHGYTSGKQEPPLECESSYTSE